MPEVNSDLEKTASQISSNLNSWESDKKPALESFSKVKALLTNIKPKLPKEEKVLVEKYLLLLQPTKYKIFKSSISELSEKEAWKLYTELSGLITSLQQLAKDTKWD